MKTSLTAVSLLSLLAGSACANNGNNNGNNNKNTKTSDVLTLGIIGDFGWTGWEPLPLEFCTDSLPALIAANVTSPREIQNDCDAGDRTYITNATAFQKATADFAGQVLLKKNAHAIVTVGDNIYDSGMQFDTDGILRFKKSWQDMYSQGIFENLTWYQCLGNHDVVKGYAGVEFETSIAPMIDSRWYFGPPGQPKLPYYTYDIQGSDWSATFVVLDSDCFIDSYQLNTSVYQNPYTAACYQNKQQQVDFLEQAFAQSKATWKFGVWHHPFLSSAGNNTGVWPLVEIVEKYNGVMINGHDHCLAHYVGNNTNYVISGAAGYPQGGDCNNGVPLGPFAKYLGANPEQGASGFVTMDISKESLVFEYYPRDMKYLGQDLYPVPNDVEPHYSFTVTEQSK